MTREERIKFNQSGVRETIDCIIRGLNMYYWCLCKLELSKDVKKYKEICENLRKERCKLWKIEEQVSDLINNSDSMKNLFKDYQFRFDSHLNVKVRPIDKFDPTWLEDED